MQIIDNLKTRFVVLLADDRVDAKLLESKLNKKYHSVILGRHTNEVFTLAQTVAFNLIILGFNKNILDIIEIIKSRNSINHKTPVIALLDREEVFDQKMLIDAGFDNCLKGEALEMQIIEVIEYWQAKNISVLNYIQLIQNKTKHNQKLTLTIFNKLFEELPLQVNAIKEALESQKYILAEETVHKLHGSVSFCDLEDIRKQAYALENCLINKKYDAVNEHLHLLQECVLNFTGLQQAILANLIRCQ
jgi:HPt (histidine-containing phosphotransfer) domain-containing protein